MTVGVYKFFILMWAFINFCGHFYIDVGVFR
jgi:hypothetical protein